MGCGCSHIIGHYTQKVYMHIDLGLRRIAYVINPPLIFTTVHQALSTLFNTGDDLYSSIKSIYGTLAWIQKQQSDFQVAGISGDFYGLCLARNGVQFTATF